MFTAQNTLITGSAPDSVLVRNLDGAGWADILVANAGEDDISVFRSVTAGSYSRTDFAAGDAPSSLVTVLGDQEDYHYDLAVTNALDGTVQLYRGDGAAGFSSLGTIACGTLPEGLSTGDVDGDGKWDLSVANMGSNTVALIENVSWPRITRISGDDRYETAVEVAKTQYPGTVSSLVLATGMDFPDALCGAPLAYEVDGPILLTRPDSLPACVSDFILDKGVTRVWVLGGEAAISPDVIAELTSLGILEVDITRLGGADRYETAYLIAMELDAQC